MKLCFNGQLTFINLYGFHTLVNKLHNAYKFLTSPGKATLYNPSLINVGKTLASFFPQNVAKMMGVISIIRLYKIVTFILPVVSLSHWI